MGAEGSVWQELCHFVILTEDVSVMFLFWFSSVTLVAIARFCSNFHHTLTIRHCMFVGKKGLKDQYCKSYATL